MTVDNQNRKISYDIDGTSVFTYAYTFDIIDVATVFLSFFDTDGTELTVAMVRVNTVSPAANEYYVDEDASQVVIGDGGDTFLQDQYGSDIAQLLITRTVEITQGVSLPTATSLQSDAIEQGLDKNTLATQQLLETVDRALVIPIQDDTSQVVDLPPAAERANKFLAFDALGNPIVGDTPAGTVIVSTAMIPVVGAATLAVARDLLEILSETEINDLLALRLALTGGTMSGAIAMGTNKITGLGDPAAAQHAATKAYVDATVKVFGTAVDSTVTANPTTTNVDIVEAQAATDLFIMGMIEQSAGSNIGCEIVGMTKSTAGPSDPADVRVRAFATEQSGLFAGNSFTMIVKAGEYYKVVYTDLQGTTAATRKYRIVPLV